MYRIALIDTSKFEYSCNGELYEFNSKPNLTELRKDYWQNIRDIGNQIGYTICGGGDEEKYLLHYNELTNGNDKDEMFRIIRVNNKHFVDVIIDVDMIIVNPDWDAIKCNLFYHNNEVVIAYGNKREMSRYVSTYCYEVSTKKLHTTRNGVGDVQLA